MNDNLVENRKYLDPATPPTEIIGRTRELESICRVLPSEEADTGCNLHLSGPHGTGKTMLVTRAVNELPDTVRTYHISCTTCDTQYKVLKQLHGVLTGEDSQNGYHASDLQRDIESRLGSTPVVIVLDDIDFLLQDDGNSLLYFLSRMDDNDSVSVITISSHKTDLRDAIENRTYSSLYPQHIDLEQHKAEEVYRILADRVEAALQPRSVRREALTYVASSISNPDFGLFWVREAVKEADGVVTESAVKESYADARRQYAKHLLEDFTDHHAVLHTVVTSLIEGSESDTVNSGAVYDGYQERCETRELERLSNRRVSDYITDLRILNLIHVDYHYGGSEGKTRKIRLNYPV